MASGAGGGGPRRAVAAPSPFGEDDGNKDDGGSHLPERERERGAGLGCARGGGDWAGPLAGLVASRAAFFFFFLKTFLFFFFWFL